MPKGRPPKRNRLPPGQPIEPSGPDAIDAGPSAATAPLPPPESTLPPPTLPQIDIPGLPPMKIRGEPNPEYFATLLDLANRRYYETTLINGEASQFNYAQFQKGVLESAKLVGLSERDVLDRRTEAQRAEDAWAKIAADPESAFGVSDDDLRALDAVIALKEQRMDSAERQCQEVLAEKLGEADTARDERGARGPKAWRRRIARILRLRERAKQALPPTGARGSWAGNQWTEEKDPGLLRSAIEAAHVLRFMVYVGRSAMDPNEPGQESKGPVDFIFDVGPHHARFAATLWCHRNGVAPVYDCELRKHVLRRNAVKYAGSIQIMAMGHGKTELAIHVGGLEMGLHHSMTGLYLHAVEKEAQKNLGSIKNFIDPSTGMGQRFLSMFPCVKASYHNDSSQIRILTKNPPKSPTFTAKGVDSKGLGIDADFQVWDDVVPQSDTTEHLARERRFDILQGTFGSRERSKKAFTLIIGTLWHHTDALMRMIDQAKLAARTGGRQGVQYGVCIQRCGGPKATARTREWQSLWPEQWSPERLRRRYGKLGPALYAAAMMANPLADEQRIVRQLRLFDPSKAEHQSFVRGSIKYISLDPSATKESKSDKAGVVYAGVGDVLVSRTLDDGQVVVDTERRVRIFDYREIMATQSDLTDYTIGYAKANPVDYIMAEAVSGFRGLIEMFEGLGFDVIRKDPRGKNKEQRLRAVAPILEDANAAMQFRAICEWPGVMNDKSELVMDPAFTPLAEQVLDFGVCASDHGLDCLTYLLGHLSPELAIGRGIVTEQAAAVEAAAGDPRLRAIIQKIMRKDAREASAEQEENEWLTRNWQ